MAIGKRPAAMLGLWALIACSSAGESVLVARRQIRILDSAPCAPLVDQSHYSPVYQQLERVFDRPFNPKPGVWVLRDGAFIRP